MTQDPLRDRDLEMLFAQQKEADRKLVPDFEKLMRHPRSPARRPSPGFFALGWHMSGWRLSWVLSAMLILAAGWWILSRPAPLPGEVSLSESSLAELSLTTELDLSWQAPSDFLLQRPGGTGLDPQLSFDTDFLRSLDVQSFLDTDLKKPNRNRRNIS